MGEVAEHEAERETRDGIRSLGQASELLFAGSGLCLRASQFVRSHTREFLSKRSIERENSLCRSPLSLRLFPVSAQVRKLQPLFSLSARAALERSAGENPRGARGRACSVDEKERNMPLACSAPPSALLEAFRCRFCPTAGKSTLQCALSRRAKDPSSRTRRTRGEVGFPHGGDGGPRLKPLSTTVPPLTKKKTSKQKK